MTQQINLFDARFAPRTPPFGWRHAQLAALAACVVSVLGALALQLLARQDAVRADALEQQLMPLRAQAVTAAASAPTAPADELNRLRALDASQRRMRTALDAGAAGAREGHAEYLTALSRQAQGSLWITGFAVSDNGESIELAGRMTEPAVLSDYLRRLNAEPRFKGRPFAQLNLSSVDARLGAGGALPYTEFTLRSRAEKTP